MTKNIVMAVTLACAWAGVAAAGMDSEDAAKVSLGEPFWSSRKMEHEPVLFIQAKDTPVASGRLLFTPSAQPVIMDPAGKMKYEEGTDYVWKKGTDTIELTAQSRIPSKTMAQMFPATGGLGGRLFSEGHYFHDLQVQVTYEHAAAWTWQPPPTTNQLARALAKLQGKREFKIVAIGDSITEGYNASGFKKVWAPPYQPCYAQLVANTLQQRFGVQVALVNLGVAGTRASQGFTQVDKLKAAGPDLVMIAFGMNHGESGTAFEATTRQLLTAVQAAAPDADIILVASMTQAPNKGKVADKFFAYRDALRRLETPNVAVADVATPFAELLKRKQFSDLSGNNYNHPNDFTHRLYAQVICQFFPSVNRN